MDLVFRSGLARCCRTVRNFGSQPGRPDVLEHWRSITNLMLGRQTIHCALSLEAKTNALTAWKAMERTNPMRDVAEQSCLFDRAGYAIMAGTCARHDFWLE
ncbi:hypothetical protein ACWGS9_14415 [Bradyrhizobium sp. Arg314]